MLIISTWLWGDTKYSIDDVEKLAAGVRRHLTKEFFEFICISDKQTWIKNVDQCMPIPDIALTRVKGCFARLRMFDPAWQKKIFGFGWTLSDRLVCIDLDTVITGPLDPLFDRVEPFMILKGANSVNPNPFCGALMMLRPGYRPDVWEDFSLEAAAKVKHFEFPDDQAWIWDRMPQADGWQCGAASGVYAFKKPGWPHGDGLPPDARMVTFNGWRSPEQFRHLPWIRTHWVK